MTDESLLKAPDDPLRRDVDALNFQVEKSMRYHKRMEGFYGWARAFFVFAFILCSSAAAAKWLEWLPLLGFAAIAFAAANHAWNPAGRERNHKDLHKRFNRLAIDIRGTHWTTELFNTWAVERLAIEEDEPLVFKALEADCDNEVRYAWDRTEEVVEIGRWSKFTMYFLRHSKKQYELTRLPKEQSS